MAVRKEKYMITDEQLTLLKKYIKESNNIVFFGGAGVSTESGIPDFRSKDGLYNNMGVDFSKYKPEYLLSFACLYHEPEVFFEFYKQKMDTREFKPNITHKVLAKLCMKSTALLPAATAGTAAGNMMAVTFLTAMKACLTVSTAKTKKPL